MQRTGIGSAWLALVVSITLSLGGCASRREPPAPPKPPAPISLLAVLPVAPPAPEESTGFGGRASTGTPVPVVIPAGPAISPGAAAGAVGVGLITAAVVQSRQESKRKERAALLAAMDEVKFDLAEQIEKRLTAALQQRQVRFVRIDEPAAAAQIRAGRFEALPPGVDAFLDVSVGQAGYEASWRTSGYSPVLQINVSIRPLNAAADDLGSFEYYADRRDAGSNKRWWTTPKSMTFATIDQIKADAPSVRAALEALVDQMVDSLGRDVERHASGQLPLD
jgi:hypothetical protein